MGMKKKVKLHNLLAYGMGDLYGGGAFTLIGLYLMLFLTKQVGMSGVLAGVIFGVGRLWDAISDFAMGYISDRTVSKYGRRRVYFILGIIPLIISFCPMWLIPFSKGTNIYIIFFYYLISYMIFNSVYTMIMTPYAALNADMSTSYKVRTKLSGFRMAFSQISSLLVGVLAPLILTLFDNERYAYFYMSLCFAVFYGIVWIFVFFGTFEKKKSSKINKNLEDANFKGFLLNAFSVLKNKSFRMQLGMYIFGFLALDAINSILFFYLNYYLEQPGLKSIATGAFFGSEILVIGIYIYIANKIGKARAFRIGLTIALVAFITLSFVTPSNASPLVVIFAFAFIGIGFSAGNVMPFAILPEVIDVDKLITTKDRAGTYAGFETFVRKTSQGLFVLPLIGLMIDLIGFDPVLKEQAEFTRLGFKYLLIIIPIIGISLAMLFSFRYKVTPKVHKAIKKEIKRLKKGGAKSEVTPEVKEICEMVSGIPYEKVYDINNAVIKSQKDL